MIGDFTPWLIAWAVATTAVIVLALYRIRLTAHEIPGVHLSGDPAIPGRQKETAHALSIVDFWGKTLTVISTILILVIAGFWGYQTYLKAYEVIGH